MKEESTWGECKKNRTTVQTCNSLFTELHLQLSTSLSVSHTHTHVHRHTQPSLPSSRPPHLARLRKVYYSHYTTVRKSGPDYLFYKLRIQQNSDWKRIVLPRAASYHILYACLKYDLRKYKVIKKDGRVTGPKVINHFPVKHKDPACIYLTSPS